MSRILRFICILAVLCLAIPPATAGASTPPLPPNCQLVVKPNLKSYVICFPPYWWNRDLVVFAHGYEFFDPRSPAPSLGAEQWIIPLSNGKTITLPELVNLLGFGFATTSYSKNGLAVQQGVAEMKALVEFVREKRPGIRNVYIVGASEGGLVTTLSMERNASTYKGGLALCGPIGDFQKQINYWGDFRALFDALYPGLPPTAVWIPDELMLDWVSTPSLAQANIITQLSNPDPANQLKLQTLFGLTGAPIDPADPTTIGATTLGILTYNVLATNEARMELSRGLLPAVLVQPYDNTTNFPLLAAGALPYTAVGDIPAILQPYQTTGMLTKPLVTMHTVGDPIVPVWHQALYRAKAAAAGSSNKLSVLPINRYGHCSFKPAEILFSFALMLLKSNTTPIRMTTTYQAVLDEIDPGSYAEFLELNQQFENVLSVTKVYIPAVTNK